MFWGVFSTSALTTGKVHGIKACIIFACYVLPRSSVELMRKERVELPSLAKLETPHDQSGINLQAGAKSRGTDWDAELSLFVQQRMSRLNKSTITDDHLDAAYKARVSEKSSLRGDRIRVAIFNNKVYGKFPTKVFHYRHRAFFEGLLDLANQRSLPNVEFVAHMADRPPCEEDEASNGLPVMTWSTLPHCNDIPIPCWTLMGRTYRQKKYASENRWQYDRLVEENRANPFEMRAAKIAWDLGTGGDDDGYVREKCRPVLGHDDVVDLQHNSGEYEKYQFSAHMEGASYSARFKNILLKGSIPVFLNPKKEQYSEYWYHWLQPNEHYLQIEIPKPDNLRKFFRDDVKEHVQHLLREELRVPSDEKARMASLGSSTAQELLKPERIFLYMEKLLQAYAAHQDFRIDERRLRKLEYMHITNQKIANTVDERFTSFYEESSSFEGMKLEDMKYMTEREYRAV